LNESGDEHADGVSSGHADVNLVVTEAMVTKLSVVVHDLVLGLADLRVVLEMHVSCNEATVQLDNLRDLEFAMGGFVQTTGSLDNLCGENMTRRTLFAVSQLKGTLLFLDK
jgi:hypothetical protein